MRLIQISNVLPFKRQAAQRRAREENKVVVNMGADTYRVQAGQSYTNPNVPWADADIDYYTVKLLRSGGEQYATCTCPFGQKAEEGDRNICKHIESVLMSNTSPYARPTPVPPPFAKGRIIVNVDQNGFVVTGHLSDTAGKRLELPSFTRKMTGRRGEVAFKQIVRSLQNTGTAPVGSIDVF